MPRSVEGSVLVSYEVRSEERSLVLRAERREVDPPERTQVRFEGVEAYHLKDDAFGNVVRAVETVDVERILSRRRAEIEESGRLAGWPWARDLDAAPAVLRARGVQGFELSASRGLTGWVLARTAAIVPEAVPVGAPPGGERRGIHALGADGSRTRLDGDGLVVAFGDGRSLVVSPSRHPWGDGGVDLWSEFEGPGGGPLRRDAEGRLPDVHAALVLHPGGGNLMNVGVLARRRDDGVVVAGGADSASSPRKSYGLVRDERRTPLPAGGFLLDLGEGRVLQVDPPEGPAAIDRVRLLAGAPPTKEDIDRLKAGGPRVRSFLTVRFGGTNFVHVGVSRPDAAHPITPPPARVEP